MIIYDKSLLEEFRDYNPPGSLRARLAYRACVKSGHLAWAKRIEQKYQLFKSDMAVAMQLSMLANKQTDPK